jgi:hypothetical protein
MEFASSIFTRLVDTPETARTEDAYYIDFTIRIRTLYIVFPNLDKEWRLLHRLACPLTANP